MSAIPHRSGAAAHAGRVGSAAVKTAHYTSFTSARSHFKELLDAAEAGLPASVTRGDTRAAVVDGGRLVSLLAHSRPAQTQVVHENGYWAAMLPGTPLTGEGETFDEAIDDLVSTLRDYAQDWTDRLRVAPNHAKQWPLVQLIELSEDEQLRDWLLAAS